MKRSKKVYIGFVTLLIFSLVIGMFYWVFMRPAFIRQDCDSSAVTSAEKVSGSKSGIKQSDYNFFYSQCLHYRGL